MGEMLRDSELSKGGRPTENQLPRGTSFPTLAEIGLSKKESMKAQGLALMPDRVYFRWKQEVRKYRKVN